MFIISLAEGLEGLEAVADAVLLLQVQPYSGRKIGRVIAEAVFTLIPVF